MEYIYCVITITLFSTIEFTGKLIGSEVTPLGVTAWRFFIGALIMLPFIKRKKLEIKDYIKMAWPGILNVAISMYFLQLAVFHGKAFLAGTVVAMNPMFVTIISNFVLKEKITFQKIAGIGFGITGLVLIITGEVNITNVNPSIYRGIFYSLMAALTFATYTVFSKKYVCEYGNIQFNFVSFLSGSIVLLSAGIVSGISIKVPTDLKILSLMAYNGIFVTGLAYILFFKAMEKLEASQASMFFFLKPVIVTFLSYKYLNEAISTGQFTGIIFAGISIVIVLLKKNKNSC
ncbi:MAG: DMT family transporter [Candidatus Muiribacteriota bacterium]|jgi:drug/metabolite transporter (DMT)-like permease